MSRIRTPTAPDRAPPSRAQRRDWHLQPPVAQRIQLSPSPTSMQRRLPVARAAKFSFALGKRTCRKPTVRHHSKKFSQRTHADYNELLRAIEILVSVGNP